MYIFHEKIEIKSPYTFIIIFLYINFDFFSLFLLFIYILSFLLSYFTKNRIKEININNGNDVDENKTEKISGLNVLSLFALLFQIKAYECLEI